MNKKEFTGILEHISPDLLINKDNQDKYQSFFLILGMIYNDLKGLIFFQKIIEDNYRLPDKDEVTVHMGEYSGLMTQANKFLISVVAEFLLFTEKNKDVVNSIPFRVLLKKVDNKTRVDWINIIDPEQDVTSIISKIARIRSNVSFHYDHSAEELRRGFVRSFFKESKGLVQHKKAYFSFGDTMEFTRFYYSDAAVDEYVRSLITGEDMANIRKFIGNMNQSIQAMLLVYIRSIKK